MRGFAQTPRRGATTRDVPPASVRTAPRMHATWLHAGDAPVDPRAEGGKQNRPHEAAGHGMHMACATSVVVVLEQFGIVVRTQQLVELVGLLDLEHVDPAVAVGVLIDGFRLVG